MKFLPANEQLLKTSSHVELSEFRIYLLFYKLLLPSVLEKFAQCETGMFLFIIFKFAVNTSKIIVSNHLNSSYHFVVIDFLITDGSLFDRITYRLSFSDISPYFTLIKIFLKLIECPPAYSVHDPSWSDNYCRMLLWAVSFHLHPLCGSPDRIQ